MEYIKKAEKVKGKYFRVTIPPQLIRKYNLEDCENLIVKFIDNNGTIKVELICV